MHGSTGRSRDKRTVERTGATDFQSDRSKDTRVCSRFAPLPILWLRRQTVRTAEIVGGDPSFLDEIRPPVILDEVQTAPEVFAHVRSRIDARPRRAGQWLLAGSQEAPLIRGVTESMAGRAAIMHF